MGGTMVLEVVMVVEGTGVLSSRIDDIEATGCYK